MSIPLATNITEGDGSVEVCSTIMVREDTQRSIELYMMTDNGSAVGM